LGAIIKAIFKIFFTEGPTGTGLMIIPNLWYYWTYCRIKTQSWSFAVIADLHDFVGER